MDVAISHELSEDLNAGIMPVKQSFESCCKINLKNTEEEISIQLVYTKRDRNVDVRQFFSKLKDACKLMEINNLEIQFKKGCYELADGRDEDVLKMVPNVIQTFQDFYKDSFRGKDEYKGANPSETMPDVNEPKKSEALAASETFSGHSDHDLEFSHNQQQKDEEKHTEGKAGSLSSANTGYTDRDVTAFGSQGSNYTTYVSNSDREDTGTTQGREQDTGSTEGNKYQNSKPEGDKKQNEKDKQKSDSKGRKDKNDNKAGEEDKTDKNKGHTGQKAVNISPDPRTESDDESNEKEEENKEGKEDKDNKGGEQDNKGKNKEHTGLVSNVATVSPNPKCDSDDEIEKINNDSIGRKQEKGNNGGAQDKRNKHEPQAVQTPLESPNKDAGPECVAQGLDEKLTEKSDGKKKMTGNEHGESNVTQKTVSHDDDRARVHYKSNNERAGSAEGRKGHDESNGSKVNSNATSNITHDNGEHNGDKDRRSAVAAEVKSMMPMKQVEKVCNDDIHSKPKHDLQEEFF